MTARLSQAELAAIMQLDRTAITKIEAGDRKIDTLELARLSEVLKRPIEWFVSAPVPAVVSRRRARDMPDESQSDALLDSLARDVALLTELGVLEPSSPIRLRRVDSVSSAEGAARELRKELGLTPGPVWDLQWVAERVGLFGFILDLQEESLDGSYLRLEQGGVAVVNGRAQTGRRRFTLMHELGHHLFEDEFSPEWILGTDGEDRERLINAFVIHFLMPREALLARWQELDGRTKPRLAAIKLGAEFGVSWTAVLGHLCNLGLLEGGVREQLEVDRPTRADYVEGGVILREELVPPAIPPGYGQAVMRAYKRHKVSAERALELLRGTLHVNELPARAQVPMESMRAQFFLE